MILSKLSEYCKVMKTESQFSLPSIYIAERPGTSITLSKFQLIDNN